ncbi:hypothetical protein K435DRAFT_665509, partial [Dendrothele bispora CBS 962.96]
RQELRELELLDEITKLKYLGKLPEGGTGETRSSILKSFINRKGNNFLPPSIHPAVAWSEDQPFTVSDHPDFTWKIIGPADSEKVLNPYTTGRFQPVKQTEMSNESMNKRKAAETISNVEDLRPQSKKQKSMVHADIGLRALQQLHNKSLVWSQNSCAYDSVIILLYHLFLQIEIPLSTNALSIHLFYIKIVLISSGLVLMILLMQEIT